MSCPSTTSILTISIRIRPATAVDCGCSSSSIVFCRASSSCSIFVLSSSSSFSLICVTRSSLSRLYSVKSRHCTQAKHSCTVPVPPPSFFNVPPSSSSLAPPASSFAAPLVPPSPASPVPCHGTETKTRAISISYRAVLASSLLFYGWCGWPIGLLNLISACASI